MASATGKADGSSAKEKREVLAPSGACATGTRRQNEKGPRATLPLSSHPTLFTGITFNTRSHISSDRIFTCTPNAHYNGTRGG